LLKTGRLDNQADTKRSETLENMFPDAFITPFSAFVEKAGKTFLSCNRTNQVKL